MTVTLPTSGPVHAARRAAAPRPLIPRRPATPAAQRLLPRGLLIALTVALLLLVLLPVSYIVLASLNSDLGVASGEFLPSSLSFTSYDKIWSTTNLSSSLGNSLVICGITAVASAVLGTSTAYVLVRYAFRGRLTILRALIGLQSLPGTLMLLPIFVLFTSAGNYLGITVINTRWGLFVAYLTFALPFSTWVMVTYLRGLPRDLEEAARIDGASNLQVLTRIVLPLSLPGVVVSGIFAFLLGWNDVLFASAMTTTREMQTAGVALQAFTSSEEGGALPVYAQMMAASLVCAVPVVVLYMIFQRYLVGGLTAGGVK